jgi:hypothetical protein
MAYFRVLLVHSNHIIALSLMILFLFKGIVSAFPVLSFSLFKMNKIECLADTETENTGKERNEKNGEKEFIADQRTIFQTLTDLPGISVQQTKSKQANYRQNAFFPVPTPPPNI